MEKIDKDQRQILAENLKKLRSDRRWNQEALAEAAGLSIGAIKTIETGVRWPRPETLKAIARALCVPEHELQAGPRPAVQLSPPTVDALLTALFELQKENDTLLQKLKILENDRQKQIIHSDILSAISMLSEDATERLRGYLNLKTKKASQKKA